VAAAAGVASPAPPALACPACRTALRVGDDAAACPDCAAVFPRHDGIWRLFAPDRAAGVRERAAAYAALRTAEGRGGADAASFRALPERDLSGRHRGEWRVRARSLAALVDTVVLPLERERPRPLTVLDLGAGCAWLAARLARRGHVAYAVDTVADPAVGLGAWIHYPHLVTPVQAEFDRLPLVAGFADLAVFNASLHYSTGYEATLGEAVRVLRPDGVAVVMDTPIYVRAASGRRMLAEQRAALAKLPGAVPSESAAEGFLTPARIAEFAASLALEARVVAPRYGPRWALRRAWGALAAGREPARFALVVFRRRAGAPGLGRHPRGAS